MRQKKKRNISMNNMNTINAFTNGVNSLCINVILGPLSEWLKETHKIEVSVNELTNILDLPFKNNFQIGTAPLQFPNLPPFLGGTVPSQKEPRQRKVAPVALSPQGDARTCQYIFQRGQKKGEMCGEMCIDGSNFCKRCITKKGAGPEDVPSEPKKKTENKKVQKEELPAKEEEPDELLAEPFPIPNYPDAVKLSTGFVVKIQEGTDEEDEYYIVLGFAEDDIFREMTELEKRQAISMGFAVIEPTVEKKPMINLGIPSIN